MTARFSCWEYNYVSLICILFNSIDLFTCFNFFCVKLSQKVSDLIYGMDVSHMFVENHGKDLTWLFVLISITYVKIGTDLSQIMFMYMYFK